jgi:hypothetical protein
MLLAVELYRFNYLVGRAAIYVELVLPKVLAGRTTQKRDQDGVGGTDYRDQASAVRRLAGIGEPTQDRDGSPQEKTG